VGTHEEAERDRTAGSTNEPAAEEILATGPPTRELDSALAKPSRGGRGLSSTILLIVGVLLAAGFLGGLFLGRATAPKSEAATFPSGGAFPGPTGAGGGFGGDGVAAGTVTRIDGNTIYVETADGQTVEVRTSGDTDVEVTSDGSVSDLTEGDTVVAQGDPSNDGSIDATSIVEGGLGGGFPGTANAND
jgi:hypothetical protein